MSLDSARYSSAQISWAVSTHTTLRQMHREMEGGGGGGGGGGERNGGRLVGRDGWVWVCPRAVHVPV